MNVVLQIKRLEKGCFPSIAGDRMEGKGWRRSTICLHPPIGGDHGGGDKGGEGSGLSTTESSPDAFPSTGAIDQWWKIDQALEAEQLDELPCYF